MAFGITYAIEKATLFHRIAHRFSPPPFAIHPEGIAKLVHPSLHNPANALPLAVSSLAMPETRHVTLYYPGCGQDLVWPLLFLSGIAPKARAWTLLCQDIQPCLGSLCSSMQTLTRTLPFARRTQHGIPSARFTFRDKTVTILFSQTSIASPLPQILGIPYHIYFERGLDLFRDQHPGFLDVTLQCLSPRGLAVTDAGLAVPGLKKLWISRMPSWGFYKNPGIYRKEF